MTTMRKFQASPQPRSRQRVGAVAQAPKVALVHDWLVAQRGGEAVLLHVAQMFPQAPIYTLVHKPGAVDARLEAHPIITSFVQALPGAPERFRRYLPLFPKAIASFDLSSYELIISTSHCVAHGVSTHAKQTHVSYVHTPMRYLYDQMSAYLPKRGRRLVRPAAQLASARLRAWDVATAQMPDMLIANSHFVAERIRRVWQREAQVVYPPVDVDFFAAGEHAPRQGLVYVGALVPYKRADCAIMLAQASGMSLTIVGKGPERGRLEVMARGEVRFVEGLTSEGLREVYGSAEALVFAGEEDFGIVPVEAMAAGCPVLALGRGGVTETVVAPGTNEAATGVLFDAPEPGAMLLALETLLAERRAGGFQKDKLVAQAKRFDAAIFRSGIDAALQTASGRRWPFAEAR